MVHSHKTLQQILYNLEVEETTFQMSHERKPVPLPQRVWPKMRQTYTRTLRWHYCAHRISKRVKTKYGVEMSGKKFEKINKIPSHNFLPIKREPHVVFLGLFEYYVMAMLS